MLLTDRALNPLRPAIALRGIAIAPRNAIAILIPLGHRLFLEVTETI